MFGIGSMEILVILLVGVLVLGPKHLPKVMRTLTEIMSSVRRVSTDFQRTINLETEEEEREQKQAKPATKKKKATPRPGPETAGQEAPTVGAVHEGTPEQNMSGKEAGADFAPPPKDVPADTCGNRA